MTNGSEKQLRTVLYGCAWLRQPSSNNITNLGRIIILRINTIQVWEVNKINNLQCNWPGQTSAPISIERAKMRENTINQCRCNNYIAAIDSTIATKTKHSGGRNSIAVRDYRVRPTHRQVLINHYNGRSIRGHMPHSAIIIHEWNNRWRHSDSSGAKIIRYDNQIRRDSTNVISLIKRKWILKLRTLKTDRNTKLVVYSYTIRFTAVVTSSAPVFSVQLNWAPRRNF